MSGSATLTIVTSSKSMDSPIEAAASVHHLVADSVVAVAEFPFLRVFTGWLPLAAMWLLPRCRFTCLTQARAAL
jgi:hypothetical protein